MEKIKNNKGFTLIEMLVTIAIISVISGLILFNITSNNERRLVLNEAEYLTILLEKIRVKALIEDQEYGLTIKNNSYQWLQYNIEQDEWNNINNHKFFSKHLPDSLEIIQNKYNDDFLDSTNHNKILPSIVFFTDSTITPFTLTITSKRNKKYQQVISSDGLSKISYQNK